MGTRRASPGDLLDHVIIRDERHLLRLLREYVAYYNADRTHLGLEGDAPEPRAVEPPEIGEVVALPRVGGLHHRYVTGWPHHLKPAQTG